MDHLKSLKGTNPNLMEKIRKNLYVDDIMMGGVTVSEESSY